MPFSQPPRQRPEYDDSAFFGLSPLNWAAAAILTAGCVLLALNNFLLFHSLLEFLSIAVAWSTFLLLWNARRYLQDKSFLVLGLGLFISGGLDILHTLSYKGMGVLNDPLGGNLSTQLWIGARTIEMLGWAGFVFMRNRRNIVLRSSLGMGLFAIAVILLIIPLQRFPRCFSAAEGLTDFKVGMEYLFIAVVLVSLVQLQRKRENYLPVVFRDLRGALLLIALGELSFTLYQDVYGYSNIVGHILRLFSRFLSYRALIQLSINHPHLVFFQQLQKEKNQVSAAENLLRSITQATTDHITDLDCNLRIRFINFPAPGLEPQDLLGTSILEYLADTDKPRVKSILQECMADRETVTYETDFAEPGGTTIHFETRASCRLDAAGQVLGLTLVSRNITDRRRRDQVLEARLRISEFALSHDVPELLTKVLDEAEQLTDSSIGFFHFVHEDQEQLHLQAWSTNTLENMCTAEGQGAHYPLSQAGVWADCLRRGTPLIHNDYTSLPHKKGMPPGHAEVRREAVVPISREGRHVAVFGVGNKEQPFTESDLQLLTTLGDLAWDIVVRKRAEITIQESERRLARTMANLPGMVFRCANDEHWTMKFVSAGSLELTGYPPEDLLDNRVTSFASLIHSEDRDSVNKGVQLGLESHTPYQIVYRINHRDGGTRWVWEQGRGLWQGDTLESIEGFIYDISEQIEAREERQAMEKRVLETQKLESLGVLAGGIAHDFNNLLQAMLGFAEMAQLQMDRDHPARENIGMVMDTAAKAAGLTRQMLAFSGKGRFSISEIDLSRHVREMAELLESSVPRSIDFQLELMDHLPPITADEAQLQQVIMNLITNAAEAIGEQAGRIRLRTGRIHCEASCLADNLIQYDAETPAPPPGQYIYLEVEDTGCGMSSEVRQRIFEPFFTTKFTGRGLGMAAVQGIIKGHGGAMTIRTAPGEGSTFRVLLPQAARRSEQATPDEGEAPAHDAPTRGRTVLVVDDEDKIRDLVRMGLAGTDFQVETAANGQEALDIFQARPQEFACVLLDLIMPRMGGRECLDRLRQLDPGVRVVIMSGYSESEIQDRLADIPTTAGILAKPFRTQQLLELLERLVPAR